MIRRDPARRKILWPLPWVADSGRTSGGVLVQNGMRPLDPDDSAFILFLAFENQPGAMFEQVGHRVFAPSREEAARVMEQNCMFQPGGR